jgi:hypothetical protein
MSTGYFRSQIEKAGIPMRSSLEFSDNLAAPSASEIDELAERSESLEQRISSLNDSYETLKTREGELTEWRWVLKEAGGFFDRVCAYVQLLLNYTDCCRHTDKQMKSDNQWTMTMLHSYRTSNNKVLELTTEILKPNNRFLS